MSNFPAGYPPVGRPSGRSRAASLATGALGAALVVVLLLAAMWALEILDFVLSLGLDRYGIVAWSPDSLPGILFAPFLHGGFGHLMANSLPLLVLGFLAAIRGLGRFAGASVIIMLVSGVGVWLTSPPHFVTIGASGLVFGYFGYVVTRGLFDRHLLDILLGVVVAVVYYSLLWGVLPTQEGVSWQGHLFGLIGGVVSAWVLRQRTRRTVPPVTRY